MDVVKVYKDYSILGHLDVIKRYDKQGEIEFEKIQDLIEQIFEVVIADGKGIELNTSSRAYKLKSLMPSKEILKLYHTDGYDAVDEEFKKRLGIKRVVLTLKASIPTELKKKLKELVGKS